MRLGGGSRGITCASLVAALILGALTSAGAAPLRDDAVEGENLKLVAQIDYLDGTHIEHATIKGRDYIFAATQSSGGGVAELRAVDVTNPERPKLVDKIACGSFQGNIQISADRKTLILGLDRVHQDGCTKTQGEGFITIDITDPTNLRPIGFMNIDGGSHSTAAHPTKPLVYNAPEGFIAPDRGASPVLEIYSIANPAKPRLVNSIALPGAHSPHDISFNRSGTMAASANISAFHLLDTSNPVNPKVMSTSQCPGCQHVHEARFTPDSKTLVVNDEAMVGPYPCPGGALYFYDLAGKKGAMTAELTGAYAISDVGVSATQTLGFCTPHVFDINGSGTRVASTWHSGGIRYLDISKRTGMTFGKTSTEADGVKEVGSYTSTGSDYFSAKLYKGPYLYAVDMTSGLQIFKIVDSYQP